MINLLVAEGYLGLSSGQYPTVRLLPKSIDVLKGTEKVIQKVRKVKQTIQADNPLFERLKKLRKELADQEGVPPYVIFADTTLREMSQHVPLTPSSLLQIKGVGETKLNKYGQTFLQILQEYASESNFPVDEVEQKKKESTGYTNLTRTKAKPTDKPSHVVSWDMLQNGMTLEEIASLRGLSIITVQDHIIRCTQEGFDVDWNQIIQSQYEPLILDTAAQLGTEKLKPIKEALPEDVDYFTIKAVLAKHHVPVI
jgi:ATP-dependent DNA helicase RecQ